jgi:cell wall-associated NlpC family hydrolase
MAVIGMVALVGAGLGLMSTVTSSVSSSADAETVSSTGTPPSATARDEIPPAMLRLYEQAAPVCPGLPWTILAAIGTVESDNGTSELPGVHSGANVAGAEGPMQFEPSTFASFDRPVPTGGVRPPSPYDPVDAVYAAARMLCADGARNAAAIPTAVFAYDHSAAYVAEVLEIASTYTGAASTAADQEAAEVALAWTLKQVGTPYVWGGETPGVGFDCSGLVQAAYRAAGIVLPRVAQDQFDAGPHLSVGAALQPGDLVFFGPSASDVTHVGMVVTPGVMVDAPHTGAFVRVEPFPTTPGAAWGDDVYVGATRPAG